MKSYAAHRYIRLVGKCWEIKDYLNALAQEDSRELTLAAYLHQQTVNRPNTRSK